jgi:leucyl-tRNA synthetase
MLLYDHKKIEDKWQKFWAQNQTFKASNHSDKPKFYALDMFPYPSGAGLHVGHPLGYIASDIVSRYKRHTGHNVLHPMGYDSFGLPAEQYAIQTGQHPAITTKENIARYREQMDRIGFSFDWSREVKTSDPAYYKYTQEIFIMLFESWYDTDEDRARPVSELVSRFRESGTSTIHAATEEDLTQFTAADWNAYDDKKQQEILLDYRLTFLADTEVNWCPELGTVLANDEIVNGVSERGGHPVVRKKMRQWMMRISAFAERLLNDLEDLDWSESIKEIQRNWIGKSVGALVQFRIQNSEFRIPVFTTRPDTIYGVTFMTLAPEHELVDQITTAEQKEAVENYKKATAARSERERMADVKTISGVFTGAYATHPLSGEEIPIWIGDYVLAGYGTGAVMAVPCGDERDHAFANFFKGQLGMPEIKNIFDGIDITEEAYTPKDNTPLKNSDFLNGMSYKQAMFAAIQKLEELGAGKGKTNYRLRDAVFSRQRYWGEPFPVYYKDGLPQMIDRKYLPLELPEVDEYLPTEDGAPPLGRATKWYWDAANNCVVENLSPTLSEGKGASEEQSSSKQSSKKVLPLGKDLGWDKEISESDSAANPSPALPEGKGALDRNEKSEFSKTQEKSSLGYFTAKPEIASTLLERAQKMRKSPTDAEAYLWKELKGKQLGHKFRQQHPIDEFIPDFVCLSKKLIIELDGKYHEFQIEKDDQRTLKLEQKLGYKVMRFSNEEVLKNIEDVLYKVTSELKNRDVITANPSPALPQGKGAFKQQSKEVLPLGKDLGWDNTSEVYPLELNTMPGWAGSSWYMFRYMDANNESEMFSAEAQEYWQNVDLYIGGSEHATGHLLYSRFWVKLLHDLGKVTVKEPFKKMINQGMILGESAFVYKVTMMFPVTAGNRFRNYSEAQKMHIEELHDKFPDIFISSEFYEKNFHELPNLLELSKNLNLVNLKSFINSVDSSLIDPSILSIGDIKFHADISMTDVHNNLDTSKFKDWRSDFVNAEFINEKDGTFKVSREVEKMSKSKYNVVNPDDICDQYGADTLRLYEMFLGPLEQAKPWNTAGITGVYGFMKKLWKLYHNDNGFNISDEKASPDSMKTLHKTIKKVREDIENFSFNTSVSSFMIAVNELTAQKCNSREVLEPLAILVSPYAPHIAEELWSLLGHQESISTADFPVFEEKYLVESSKTYPISFNGKMKFTLDLPVDITKDELEKLVLDNDKVQEQLEGKQIRKTIIVPGKIVNFVIG